MMTMFAAAPSGASLEGWRSKKPEEWTNRCNLLLKSFIDALTVLYEGLETEEGSNLTDADKEQNLVLKGEETLSEVAKIAIEYCQKLSWLIREPTNGPVRLPLNSVIRAVSRCLGVSYKDVRLLPSMSELAGCLPEVHRAALELLSQLVLSCKTNILPQSRLIIDLCLQALASAKHMDISERSKTAACIYQTLCLIVQIFGWGRYLTQQYHLLAESLITDIRWQGSVKPATSVNKDKNKDVIPGNRKKGKKKKNKAESYNDLIKTNPAGEISLQTEAEVTSNLEATVGALELSKLILRNVGFTYVENMMRCVLETTKKVQCQHLPVQSPYTKPWCRRALYSAVLACSNVRLDQATSRKDSITHFQLTNLSLSLLNEGSYNDSSHEIRNVCKESINILLMPGNLNRPIIRRVQPDDSAGTKDITELEREMDEIREERDNLQKKLLDSEMENHTQTFLITTLRQEIETLKASRKEQTTPCSDQKVYLSDPTDNRLTDNCSEKSFEFEREESDEEEEDMKEKVAKKVVEYTEDKKQDRHTRKCVETISAAEADRHHVPGDDSQGGNSRNTKRKCLAKQSSELTDAIKKSKVTDKTEDNSTSVDIQDMILDFVDAEPDT